MQTDRTNEKAPSEESARGHMQTGIHSDGWGAHLQPARPITQRQARALAALLQGPVSRERLDRVAGSSNSPDVVARLRRGRGLAIPCRMVKGTDRDGHAVETGEYHLTPADCERAAALLRERNRVQGVAA